MHLQLREIRENQNKLNKIKTVICREKIITFSVVIYTIKDFFLLDVINEKIEDFKAAGLTERWQFQFFDKNSLKIEESNQPNVLTVEQMIGSIYILLIGCTVAFVIFLCELIKFKMQ